MKILQKAFSAELITAATSDEEFGKIEAAVSKVAELLASRPTEYVAAAYLAAGSGEAKSELLADVYTLVQKEWRTVVTRYAGFPTQMVRAILLCAVVELARKKVEFASALGLILPNVQPHLEGKDDVIALWKDIAEDFQRGYEEKAEKQWSVPASVDLPELDLSEDASRKIEASQKGLNQQGLANVLLPAFTNVNSDGEALEGGNPHAPQEGEPWASHAASKLASSLAGPVANGLATNISAPDNEALASELADHLVEVVERLVSAVQGQDMRTRLLWWKESGYSPSGRAPYREFSSTEKVLHSVADLSAWLPRHTPPSAFQFIRDALDVDGVEVAVSDLANADARKFIASLHDPVTTQWEGRSLIQVLDPSEAANIEAFTLDEKRMRDPRDLVEHLLREILALRILADVKPAKKPRV